MADSANTFKNLKSMFKKNYPAKKAVKVALKTENALDAFNKNKKIMKAFKGGG